MEEKQKPFGKIFVSNHAIATIAYQSALESYGVVGMADKDLMHGLAKVLFKDPTSGVIIKATHEEIGDAIGAVRQTVSENLSIMKKHGLVLTGPRRIQLLDRRELEEIVRNSEGTVGSK